MTRSALFALAVVAGVIACGTDAPATAQELPPAQPAIAASEACAVERSAASLPDEVRETSGLARGSAGFWTHNDAGNANVIYRLDDAGRIAQRVTIEGARLEDWEDIEAAPCQDGTCLYIADIGDNDAERRRITIYRVREPAATATSARADAVHLSWPDGARDAEALFVDATGTAWIVTKGRREDIALYRVPAAAWSSGSGVLERARRLAPRPSDSDDRVTAATATPDGRWVALRTYRTLYLFPLPELIGAETVTPVAYDLSAFGQAQAESVVLANDGVLWTSSEAENRGSQPSWISLRCSLPGS